GVLPGQCEWQLRGRKGKRGLTPVIQKVKRGLTPVIRDQTTASYLTALPGNEARTIRWLKLLFSHYSCL
ncbi:MAG: hypothetical protein KJN95_10425, partial [Gammaproteobacteria bacterium]|nr:hypothetical protein [Gammaproteobacteria bacterium]